MTFEEEQRIVKAIQEQVAPIEGWCHPEKVDVLARLVLTYRPSRIFELGVHAGKSLCTFGLALQAVGAGLVVGVDSWRGDDEVRGIDPDEQGDHYRNWKGRDLSPYKQMCEWNIDKLGIGAHVQIIQAESEAAAAKLVGEPLFDLLHIDASKSRSQVPRFIDLWLPWLRVGGFLVLDDTDWQTGRMAQIHARRRAGGGPCCVELLEVFPQEGSWFAVLERMR